MCVCALIPRSPPPFPRNVALHPLSLRRPPFVFVFHRVISLCNEQLPITKAMCANIKYKARSVPISEGVAGAVMR